VEPLNGSSTTLESRSLWYTELTPKLSGMVGKSAARIASASW
jgi:hypothetical protein